MFKKLIFNNWTTCILFFAALYLGYRAFFTMDTKTAFVTMGFAMCSVFGNQVQRVITKNKRGGQ